MRTPLQWASEAWSYHWGLLASQLNHGDSASRLPEPVEANLDDRDVEEYVARLLSSAPAA